MTKTITDDQLKEMVGAIENPAIRAQYEKIIGGQITHALHCMSKVCKGRVIAHRYHDGQWVSANETTKSGLLSSRERFDGNHGFRCMCGNDSILAEQEKGTITAGQPSKKDLMTIFGKIQAKPTETKLNANGTALTVDGFTIEQLKGEA